MCTVPATSGLPLRGLQSHAEDLAFISPDHNGTSVGMLKITCYTECYHSRDTIKEQDVTDFHLPVGADDDLLGTIQEPVVPPAALSLKVGCITSIMRNLSIEDALVMNAREVVALRPNVIQIRLLQQGAIRRRARVWPTCRLSSFRGSASSSSHRVRIGRSSVASSHSDWHMPPRSTAASASPWIAWCLT
jgi:hypothetical protein